MKHMELDLNWLDEHLKRDKAYSANNVFLAVCNSKLNFSYIKKIAERKSQKRRSNIFDGNWLIHYESSPTYMEKPLDTPSGFSYNNINSEIHIHRQIRPLHLADIPPNSLPILISLLMPNMQREERRKRILRVICQTVSRIRRGRPCSPAGVPFHTGGY